MKKNNLRELAPEELGNQLRDMSQQIWKIRFQLLSGQAEGVGKLRLLRKDIARAKTILRERELGQLHGK
ncbi:MAG: 50S ribosomal protein L29 [Acidobacteria bacterium RIFCSPLOWO2_12_FULL_54_10]|nr:MAG: 50S ribosomal protein L29 [Acidobacteria bacterium RIFCSPLOWO2_12_FULL_54_10]